MKPTIGRIVHYTNLGDRDGKYPPEIQAAIITGVNDDGTVALHVFYKTGQFDMPSVARAVIEGMPEGPAPAGGDVAAGSEDARGKWQWPARESA
jgi:hypothetical protein